MDLRLPPVGFEHDLSRSDPLLVRVGGLTRVGLIEALTTVGVLLNDSAAMLLDDVVFDHLKIEDIQVVECTVGELGCAPGASLSQVFAAAQDRGLQLCSAATGPYMRLSMLYQTTASDLTMSNGRAPSGSVTIASPPLREADDYPKGFYLRVVDGVPWLRGYRCTDEHAWSPEDRFAFRLPSGNGLTQRRADGPTIPTQD